MDDPLKSDRLTAWRQVQALIQAYEARHGGQGQAILAQKSGVSQPTISRLRTAPSPPSRIGGGFRKLFIYSSRNNARDQRPDPRGNANLIGALEEVWNGTDEHARALAAIIRATQDVARAVNLSS